MVKREKTDDSKVGKNSNERISMKVNREDLLKVLKVLNAGRDKELTDYHSRLKEQFILTKDSAIVQNDEICMIAPVVTGVKDGIIGFPEELLGVLNGMDSDEVSIRINKKKWEATIRGGGVKSVITVSQIIKIREPDPDKWKKLPTNFTDAIDICKSTSSTSGKYEFESCIKIEGNQVYSTDSHRVSKYQLKKKMPTILIPTKYANALSKMGATRYSKDDNQTYFGNDDGIIFALMHITSEFPDCDDLFEHEGFKLDMPEDIANAIRSVIPFSKSNDEETSLRVDVTINSKGVLCRSENDRGWIEAPIKGKIDIDEEIRFGANPEHLLQILETCTSAYVTKGQIMFDTPNYKQVLALLRD